ncbi:adenine phosphoribosyltransferase [Phaffia rhodozyma]|uniref:adenine phosphoribosyltransferase n=1 Tax=Phaffia rhodozyma TaxID=264483 RepID=A0A0F7SIL2_PHARH|nr:adenine phosphoribosyltransferase [Phaffia rhodozyma]
MSAPSEIANPPATTEVPTSDVAHLKSKMGLHPNFPIKGVTFIDFLPILRDPQDFEMLLTHFLNHIYTVTMPKAGIKKIDAIVGLDARGFLLGPPLALRLGCSFVPVRKAKKLPGACHKVTYSLEYGEDAFEIQEGSLPEGANVLVVDDLIATGGSASAAGQLVKKAGGKTIEYLFVVGLPFLNGDKKLDAPSYWIVEGED